MSTKERKHPAPPRYDEAFKAGAVRMVTEQGRPSREVAAELGICIDTLRSWLKAAGAPSPGQADRQNRDARRRRELEAEIRALRKKLEEKDGVIDILKKSVGILSKPYLFFKAFYCLFFGKGSKGRSTALSRPPISHILKTPYPHPALLLGRGLAAERSIL